MFPSTHCAFCHNSTATGCKHCNPGMFGRIDIDIDVDSSPPDIYKELEEIKRRLDELEKKNV